MYILIVYNSICTYISTCQHSNIMYFVHIMYAHTPPSFSRVSSHTSSVVDSLVHITLLKERYIQVVVLLVVVGIEAGSSADDGCSSMCT